MYIYAERVCAQCTLVLCYDALRCLALRSSSKNKSWSILKLSTLWRYAWCSKIYFEAAHAYVGARAGAEV